MGVASNIQVQQSGRRLTPTMSSRKLQALDFIKRYFAQWGKSPTLGELGAELGVSNKRAHDLVHQLSDDRQIEVTGGTRGIRLMDRGEELSEADVLLRLRSMGWTIGLDGRVIQPPGPGQQGLTEKGLPDIAELDHEEGDIGVAGSGTNGEGEDQGADEDPRHTKRCAEGDRRAG